MNLAHELAHTWNCPSAGLPLLHCLKMYNQNHSCTQALCFCCRLIWGILVPAELRCGAAPSRPCRNPPTLPSFLSCSLVWAHSRRKSWDSSFWSISSLFLRGKPGKFGSRGSSGGHCCLLLQNCDLQPPHSSLCTHLMGTVSTKSKGEFPSPLQEVLFSLGFGMGALQEL